jgi:hypothetical protein
MAPAIILALLLLAGDPPPAPQASSPAPAQPGEPLPPGAPTDDYQLAAWCYGAMSEYLDVYEHVKPELKDIDRMFGTSVKNEAEPYFDDMQAARAELKVLAGAVEAAEKASAQPIAPTGVAAIKLGRSVWTPAEEKTRRELARAWLSWALPDACDTRARALAARSQVLGAALTYNNPDSAASPDPAQPPAPAPPPEPAPADPAGAAVDTAPPPSSPPNP